MQIQVKIFEDAKVASSNCRVCRRKLSNPTSVMLGIGPVCRGKVKGENMPMTRDLEDVVLLDTPITEGIIFGREGGKRVTNIPRVAELHSPDGFEWGYGGSGPADFALNILEAVLSSIRYNGPRKELQSGDKVFELSERLHQPFKSSFIATADHAKDNFISFDKVVAFIVESCSVYC
jgi:hypothetical protein